MALPPLPPLPQPSIWTDCELAENCSSTDDYFTADQLRTYAEQYGRLCAEAAEARVAELEVDAERYRFLRPLAYRETASDRYKGARWWLAFHEEAGTAKSFDAAIDTARKAKP